MIICTGCGTKINETDTFCPICGRKVATESNSGSKLSINMGGNKTTTEVQTTVPNEIDQKAPVKKSGNSAFRQAGELDDSFGSSSFSVNSQPVNRNNPPVSTPPVNYPTMKNQPISQASVNNTNVGWNNIPPEPPKKKKKSFLKGFFITTFVLSVLAAAGFSVWYLFFKTKMPSDEEVEEMYAEFMDRQEIIKREGYVSFNPDTIDGLEISISDENDILSELDSYNVLNGVSLEDEYEQTNADIGDNVKTYTYRQYYDGVEILGADLQVYLDADDNMLGMSGRHIDSEYIEDKAKLSEEEVDEKVREYIADSFGCDESEVVVNTREFIYAEGEENYEPAYLYTDSFGDETGNDLGGKNYVVSAISGNVLYESSPLMIEGMETVEKDGQGDNKKQTFSALHEDDRYYLKDTDKNIYTINCNGEVLTSGLIDEIRNNNYDKNMCPNFLKDGSDDVNVDESTIDAYANMQRTYTTYYELFKRKGMMNDENIPVLLFTNTNEIDIRGYEETSLINNSFNCSYTESGNDISFVGITVVDDQHDNSYSLYLDWLGHEYTHGVVYKECEKRNNKLCSHEFGAMNEGFADFFGDMVEDYSDDKKLNGTNNWVFGDNDRDFSNEISVQKFNDKTDCHDGSFVVTHSIYLMHNGFGGNEDRKVDNKSLAYMNYDLLSRLDSMKGFSDYRKNLEWLIYRPGENGDEYKLSDEQMDCLIDALDEIDIEETCTDIKILNYSRILFYDEDMNECKNLSVSISDFYGRNYIDKDIGRLSYVDLSKKNIPSGLYNIDVTDNETDKTYRYIALINDNNDHTLAIEPYAYETALFLDDDFIIDNSERDKTIIDQDFEEREKTESTDSETPEDEANGALSIDNLPMYVKGGASVEVMEAFFAEFPWNHDTHYDDIDTKYHGDPPTNGVSDDDAFYSVDNTLRAGLVDEEKYILGNGTNTVDNVPWGTTIYDLDEINNAIDFFTDLDFNEDNYPGFYDSDYPEDFKTVVSGNTIEATGYDGDRPLAKFVSAEFKDGEILLYYRFAWDCDYGAYTGAKYDKWLAYFRKCDDGLYQLYKAEFICDYRDDPDNDDSSSESGSSGGSTTDWKSAYIDFLNAFESVNSDDTKFEKEDNGGMSQFDGTTISIGYETTFEDGIDIVDINSDGIPELILKDDWTDYVVTYYNGEIRWTSFDAKYGLYISTDNAVTSAVGGTGWYIDCYEELKDGKFSIICEGVRDCTDLNDPKYYWTDTDPGTDADGYAKSIETDEYLITEEEYDEKVAELEDKYNIYRSEGCMTIDEAIDAINNY